MYPVVNIELLKKWTQLGYRDGYTINSDNSVDVMGDVYVYSIGCGDAIKDRLPFKFGKISGNFICSGTSIETLENFPDRVHGFSLRYNSKLKSLDYAPSHIHGNLSCYGNTNLPYRELFKVVDRVKGGVFMGAMGVMDTKEKVLKDRDLHLTLHHEQLGSLNL